MEAITISKNEMTVKRIAELTADIRTNFRSAAMSIATIGHDLIEAKGMLSHGEWLPWLRSLGIGVATADNYMRYAREITPGTWLSELPYTKALALLSVPEKERETFAQANNVEDKSAAEIRQLISELKAEKSLRRKAEQQAMDLQDQLQNREPEVKIVREVVPPEGYDELKSQVQKLKRRAEEAEEAACEAEERAAQAVSDAQRAMMQQADCDPDPDGHGLSLDDFISACNDFTGRTWAVPFMEDHFRNAGADARKSYRLLTEGIHSWSEQVLRAIDRAGAPILLQDEEAVVL